MLFIVHEISHDVVYNMEKISFEKAIFVYESSFTGILYKLMCCYSLKVYPTVMEVNKVITSLFQITQNLIKFT